MECEPLFIWVFGELVPIYLFECGIANPFDYLTIGAALLALSMIQSRLMPSADWRNPTECRCDYYWFRQTYHLSDGRKACLSCAVPQPALRYDSSRRQPSVHHQLRARDVRRLARRQEQHRITHLVRPSPPPHRHVIQQWDRRLGVSSCA